MPALVLAPTACGTSGSIAHGTENSIIVVAVDSLWSQVQDSVDQALETRVYTVRPEKTFKLTQVSPESQDWVTLRQFRQVLAVGTPEDEWVADALKKVSGPVPGAPALVAANDVWARGQRVTIVLLPHDGAARAMESLLPRLHAQLDERFRAYVHERMFASGVDEALADTLKARAGFTLRLPNIYRKRDVNDSTYVFFTDKEEGNPLVRWITVTWRPGPRPLSRSAVLDWRQALVNAFYDWKQTVDTATVRTDSVAGFPQAREVRGVWNGTVQNFPQAGPFITRLIPCPAQNREYLLDAWLYAPASDKYEYMLQLDAILGSFDCGAS
ncbi:MAG TPA: DUF4837 family protein [Longimicrobiales bacterium]|nr:DUF4837 family protein [Longimicrobiales bacterium]